MTMTSEEQELAVLELEATTSSLPAEATAFKIVDQTSMTLIDAKLQDAWATRQKVIDFHADNISMAKTAVAVAKATLATVTATQDKMLAPVDQAISTYKGYLAAHEAEQRQLQAQRDFDDRKRAQEAQDRIRAQQMQVAKEQAQRDADRRILEAATEEEMVQANDAREEAIAQAVQVAREAPLPVVQVSSQASIPVLKSSAITTAWLYSAQVDDEAKLVKAVAEGRASSAYVKADLVALNRVAVALKEGFNVPGCSVVKKPSQRRR